MWRTGPAACYRETATRTPQSALIKERWPASWTTWSTLATVGRLSARRGSGRIRCRSATSGTPPYTSPITRAGRAGVGAVSAAAAPTGRFARPVFPAGPRSAACVGEPHPASCPQPPGSRGAAPVHAHGRAAHAAVSQRPSAVQAPARCPCAAIAPFPDPSFWKTCPRCGADGRLHLGCLQPFPLHQQLQTLLTDTTGEIRFELRALHETLAGVDGPAPATR